jgi:hypothetical protein
MRTPGIVYDPGGILKKPEYTVLRFFFAPGGLRVTCNDFSTIVSQENPSPGCR